MYRNYMLAYILVNVIFPYPLVAVFIITLVYFLIVFLCAFF